MSVVLSGGNVISKQKMLCEEEERELKKAAEVGVAENVMEMENIRGERDIREQEQEH